MNIYIYIIRRLFYAIPILLGVCFVIFFLFNIIFDSPAELLLGKHPTPEQIESLNRELGLQRPWPVQYLDVVKSAFTFDFGRSWASKQEISQMIKDRLGPTLSLSVPAFFISTILGIVISLFVAFYRGKMIDRITVIICVIFMSISSLAYILFGQWFFAYKLGWFEISGYEYGFPYFLPYIGLPILIWVALAVGPDVRFYRTLILDEIYQDYVRTAKAKGLSEKLILFKHVLKNAMIPIITYVIMQIPFLILGALLLESFFSIPGLGGMTIAAANSSDFPVIKAMTIVSAVFLIIFNLFTDILYTLVDPRIRLK
ncbi:MAG: ABC transporter permease [Halobacteriovoraceae bacterium]|nr:ABC transporter permease [Halobacteriovoraceae bacterium]